MDRPSPFGLILLPTELRYMVWESCLPNHADDFLFVVGGVCMDTEGILTGNPIEEKNYNICECPPGVHTTTNNRLPAVAAVCSESLAVARRHRHGMSKTQISWPFAIGSEFLTLPEEFFEHSYSPSAFRRALGTLVRFIRHADRIGTCPAIPWTHTYTDWNTSWLQAVRGDIDLVKEFLSLCQNRRLAFVNEVVTIHASREQAAASGLFGTFAKETCQVVNIADARLVRRFFNFWESVTPAGPRKLDAVRSVWQHLGGDKAWGFSMHQLKQWQRKYIHAQWRLTASDDETLADVYPHREDCPFTFDVGHPWIEATVASMPKIELKIIFRLCTRIRCVQPEEESLQTVCWPQ